MADSRPLIIVFQMAVQATGGVQSMLARILPPPAP